MNLFEVANISSNWLHSASIGTDAECSAEQLVIVDFSHNRIQSISSSDLTSLVAIRQLSFAHNQIGHIHREAFQSNSLLRHLDLEGNRIQEMPLIPGGTSINIIVFEPNKSNRIADFMAPFHPTLENNWNFSCYFPAGHWKMSYKTFFKLWKLSESVIDLNAACNRLSIIPATVANLPNLISLNLSSNSIDASTPFPLSRSEIEVLDLSYNRFESIPTSLIDNCSPTLTHLNLCFNRIEQIPPNAFSNFTRLQTVSACL